jgi:hypothetical protein
MWGENENDPGSGPGSGDNTGNIPSPRGNNIPTILADYTVDNGTEFAPEEDDSDDDGIIRVFLHPPPTGWRPGGGDDDDEPDIPDSCFIAGTLISMSDNTKKKIENISVGDEVKTSLGSNIVIKLDPTILGNRKLYSFNGSENYFVTSEHPFMTSEGWKSIKPEMTKLRDGIEMYEQLSGALSVGDKLVHEHGLVEVESIESKVVNSRDLPLYNFVVEDAHQYYADGFLVHNTTKAADEDHPHYFLTPPDVTGVDTPYVPTETDTSYDVDTTPLTTDFSSIMLDAPASDLRGTNPLLGKGIRADAPELIASHDMLPISFDAEGDPTTAAAAGEQLLSNAPKKYIRLQILSGLAQRMRANAIYHTLRTRDRSPALQSKRQSAGLASPIDNSVINAYYVMMATMMAVRRDAQSILTGYTAQTARNMYIRAALQIVRSLESRDMRGPAAAMTSGKLRGSDGALLAGPASAGFGEIVTSISTVGKYEVAEYAPGLTGITYDGDEEANVTITLDAIDDARTISAHFTDLGIGPLYTEQRETTVMAQIVHELRRCILVGSWHVDGGGDDRSDTVSSTVSGLTDPKITVYNDLNAGETPDFVNAISELDSKFATYGTMTQVDLTGIEAAVLSGRTAGGVIPRDGDGARMALSSGDINFQRLSNADALAFTESIPTHVDGVLFLDRITYLCHFLTRDFIMSKRWKLLDESTGARQGHSPVFFAQRFDSDIDFNTSIPLAIDEVIGDNSGRLSRNDRSPDSYTSIFNAEFEDALAGPSVDEGTHLRMLPFETDLEGDEVNEYSPSYRRWISGYQAYINSLVDDLLLTDTDDSTASIFNSPTLEEWAEESQTKYDDLRNFVRSLLMTGDHYDEGGDYRVFSCNHLLLKACSLALSKFFINSNRISSDWVGASTLGGGMVGEVPPGWYPTKYQHTTQLSMVWTCMDDDTGKGFRVLEAYLRYRREARMLYDEALARGETPVKWPDLGDFAGSTVMVAAGYGGGLTDESSAFGVRATIQDVYGVSEDMGSGYAETQQTYDDTFWWEMYYGAFAGAYPRFAQAAYEMVSFYMEKIGGSSTNFGDMGDKYCAKTRLTVTNHGQTQTRYGLMATILGASVIQEYGDHSGWQGSGSDEGEMGGGSSKPLFDYMIDAYDDFVQLVADADNDINAIENDFGGMFSDGSTHGEYHSPAGEAQGTFYRGLSLRTYQASMYFIMGQLVKRYAPCRGKANMVLSDFPAEATDDVGYPDAVSAYFDGEDDEATPGIMLSEAFSTTSTFEMDTRFMWDAAAPMLFVKGVCYWGGHHHSDILGITQQEDWWAWRARTANRYTDPAQKGEIIGEGCTGNLFINVSNNPAAWITDGWFSEPGPELTSAAAALVREDHIILRSLNYLSNMHNLITEKIGFSKQKTTTPAGVSLSETGDYNNADRLIASLEAYQEYIRKQLFGTDEATGLPIASGVTSAEELDDSLRSQLYSFFKSMTLEGVASSHMILGDNFTLSRAFLNIADIGPNPFTLPEESATFHVPGDPSGASSPACFSPSSETLNSINYAAIQWFSRGANVKGKFFPADGEPPEGFQPKKILTIGIPIGLVQQLRDKASVEEITNRADAYTDSNYTRSSLIRIRVMKKPLDNESISYTPRTFYFDTQLFFPHSQGNVQYPSLKGYGGTSATFGSPRNLNAMGSTGGDHGIIVSRGRVVLAGHSVYDIPTTVGPLKDRAETLAADIGTLAVERSAFDEAAGIIEALGASETSTPTDLDGSNLCLKRFVIGLTDSLDYDVESDYRTWPQAGDYVEDYYSEAINGYGTADSTDPTHDFFADVENEYLGLSEDPWSYDQLTGDHYSVAMAAGSTQEGFAKQVAANEFYSGILKMYIRAMCGFDMHERCFPTSMAKTHLHQKSTFHMTKAGRDSYSEYTGHPFHTSAPFGDIGGTVPAPGGVAKLATITCIEEILSIYAGLESGKYTQVELQNTYLSMLQTLPVSSEKYRDQGLLPRIFDRTFCVLIDPVNDFQPYIPTDTQDPFKEFGLSTSLDDVTVEHNGRVYCFLVDVALVPMNSADSGMLLSADADDLEITDT